MKIEINNKSDFDEFVDKYADQFNSDAVSTLIEAVTGVKVFVIDKPTKEQLKELTEYYINSGKDADEHPIFLIRNRPSDRKQPDE